ncbi:MAG TPA: TadE/TadG family type IV pilus assembly protein, partial [Anaerolineaceae bacterium]|nr:TadE/TadG family type IV pilus assembly protein [Anaerolineaceae bacterium]
EKGQSMVELAVAVVVLLILVSGVVDLGRVAFHYIAMRDAAQEAASYASVFPNNNQQIFMRATDGIAGDGVDPSRIEVNLKIYKASGTYECNWSVLSPEVCAADVDSSDSNEVSVNNVIEVTITDSAFPITMPLLGSFLGSQTINLNTTIQDVVLYVPE